MEQLLSLLFLYPKSFFFIIHSEQLIPLLDLQVTDCLFPILLSVHHHWRQGYHHHSIHNSSQRCFNLTKSTNYTAALDNLTLLVLPSHGCNVLRFYRSHTKYAWCLGSLQVIWQLKVKQDSSKRADGETERGERQKEMVRERRKAERWMGG